jgi:DSF synthase
MNIPAAVMAFPVPHYTELLTHIDPERHALWYYLNPSARSVFTRSMLGEILDLQKQVCLTVPGDAPGTEDIRYLVLASATPEVFSHGGDLALFAELIRRRDRDTLIAYGRLCVECVHANATSLGNPQLTTISLVQGSALGGGFEAALSSHVLVAERSASMGLPEILFNLFPGMGAFQLLARRLDMARAERLLTSGRQYSAVELHDMGVVDVLAEDGEGVQAVNAFIRRHSRSRTGLLAIQQVRQHVAPLSLQELQDVVTIWADTAIRLTERDLRTMEKLVAAQQRLVRQRHVADATANRSGQVVAYAGAA